jgi:beta-N-acetylhexosaminidase
MNFSIGELVIMGFAGKFISDETLKTVQKEGVSQFILFSSNYESKEQLLKLTDELQNQAPENLPFLVSADQEGGRVQRFRGDFTRLPSAKDVGATGKPSLAFELALLQARELFAAGIQLNFAPVCDINTNPQNPVIGDRAYGDNADLVTRMVAASVRGHLDQGVEPCLKHFPGHGDTHQDSHFALPTVTTDLKTLRAREWIPFQRAIKSGCNFVMSAHLMLPHLDPHLPGTLSETFLKTYLRQELRFSGVMVSDDLEMHAITKNFGAEQAPILALQAGCDQLCYKSEAQALIGIEAIKKALKDGKLNESQLAASVERVRSVRHKMKLAKKTMTFSERMLLIGHADHQMFVKENFKDSDHPDRKQK